MRRRRLASVSILIIVVAAVIAVDTKILTHPPLVRVRVEREIARIFGHVGAFRHPSASLGGRILAQELRLAPSHRLYSLNAREIDVQLDRPHLLVGEQRIDSATLREATLVWNRGDRGWDLRPFLRFCVGMRASSLSSARIEDLEIVIRDGMEDGGWTVDLDEVLVDVTKEGVRMRGRSTRPPWDLLRFDILAGTDGERFDGGWIQCYNLRIRPDDIAILPRSVREILTDLHPRGTIDVRIDLHKSGEMEVRIDPVNLALRPEAFPYPLRKITVGSILVDPAGVRIVGLETKSGLGGSGSFPLSEDDGGSQLDLVWDDLDLDETLAAALPEDLGWIWSRIRPTGRVGGRIAISPSRGTFGDVEGTLTLRPLRLDLPVPVELRGGADLREAGSRMALSLRGLRFDVMGWPLGTVARGEIVIGDRGLHVSGVRGGSEAGVYHAAYSRSREWPFEWDGRLVIVRRDLGAILSRLAAEDGPGGGDLDLWIEAGGREGESEGWGEVSFFAQEGRSMPILRAILPPGPDRPAAVRGRVSMVVTADGIRCPLLEITSGSDRAIGEGEIGPGGSFRFRILSTSGRGAIGPRAARSGGIGEGAGEIEIEGTGAGIAVIPAPAGRRAGGGGG